MLGLLPRNPSSPAPRSAWVAQSVLLVVLLAGTAVAQPQDFVGKVVGVSDGDTITVRSGQQTVKVRLAGID